MENFWKIAGATGRKRSYRFAGENRVFKPLAFATDCHQSTRPQNGKEGVDGSSPSEGFMNPLLTSLLVVC